jgi:ribonuclease HI
LARDKVESPVSKSQKWYVVWQGRRPGIYASWGECADQVKGFPDAKYKAFPTRAEAEAAFKSDAADYIGRVAKPSPELLRRLGECYVVDAACSGYPGPVEYRCVHLPDGKEVFRQGPFADGSVNVGEFLAIVHALALFKEKQITAPVYSDSEIALGWVNDRHCKTKLLPTEKNAKLFDLIRRAEHWLEQNEYPNKVLKWETEEWGENPADFGRK